MKQSIAIIAALTLGLGLMGQARGVESPTQVTSSVPGSCTVVAPPNIAFGVYDASGANYASGANKDVTGTFVVRCNKGSLAGAAMKISMGPGLNQDGAGCLNRRMSNGNGGLLRYDIHTIASRSIASKWGCMSMGENGLMGATYDNGQDHTITMYARLGGGQGTVPSGSYSDTMEIIISF